MATETTYKTVSFTQAHRILKAECRRAFAEFTRLKAEDPKIRKQATRTAQQFSLDLHNFTDETWELAWESVDTRGNDLGPEFNVGNMIATIVVRIIHPLVERADALQTQWQAAYDRWVRTQGNGRLHKAADHRLTMIEAEQNDLDSRAGQWSDIVSYLSGECAYPHDI